MIHFREVLFKRNFFSLWSGQIISEFGDRLNQMALIALIYSKNPGSVMALAKLLFFIVIPVFVVGPVAGVYVDRWDRKKVMVIADIARGIFVLTIPLFLFLNMMTLVYVAVFFIFSATRFFLPSKMALIPAIVSKEKLIVANSLSSTTRMLATILGFALAGFIVEKVGHIWGFYLDSISYFISACFIASISLKKKTENIKEDIHKTKEIIEKSIRKNLWHEILDGFGHMFKKDKMKMVTSSLFLIMAGTGSIFCISIVFIQEAFGSATKTLGMLGVFLGVGLFLGTIVFGKFGQHLSRLRTIFTSFALCGAALGVFAFYSSGNPTLIGGGILVLLVGATAAPILICSNTLIHTLVPDEIRGRIFSSMEAVMYLAFLMFMFLTAYLSRYIDNLTILLASGICFVIVGTAGQFYFLTTLRVGDQQDL